MNQRHTLSFLLAGLFLAACQQQDTPQIAGAPPHDQEFCETCGTEQSSANDKIYERGGRLFLWGGESRDWHFDITGWSLEGDLLTDWGNDRESFPALIRPDYVPVSTVSTQFSPGEPVIYLKGGGDTVRVYPYVLMKYHEVINEVVDGVPVMIAYCFLADLAAVYNRTYCDQEFTFGLTGYTYGEEHIWQGRQGFVLWDRDTESLWWPLIDRAVSGTMKNTLLRQYTPANWGLSTWVQIKNQHPNALVLESDRHWLPPVSWEQYAADDLSNCDR